jgi:hypothetical protein
MSDGDLSQGLRVSTGNFDTVNDDFPGGGSSSPGFAPSQLGKKVKVAADSVLNFALAENRLPGTLQYIRSLSTDTQAPGVGQLAFWSDRTNFIVSTAVSSTTVENFAGIWLGAYPNSGKYGYIKIAENGGKALVNFAGSTPAAGEIALAQTGSNVATRVAAGTDLKGYSFGVIETAKGGTGSYGADAVVVSLRAPVSA